MKLLNYVGRWLAIGVSIAVAASATAQTPPANTPQNKPPPAKSAKLPKKSATSGFKLILEPKAMDLLKAVSA